MADSGPGHPRTFDHQAARDMYATGQYSVREVAVAFGSSNRNMYHVLFGRQRGDREEENRIKREWWAQLTPEERRAYYDARQKQRDRARLRRWSNVPVKPKNANATECPRPDRHLAHLWARPGHLRGSWCSGKGYEG